MKDQIKAVNTERKGFMDATERGEALDVGERNGVSQDPFKALVIKSGHYGWVGQPTKGGEDQGGGFHDSLEIV